MEGAFPCSPEEFAETSLTSPVNRSLRKSCCPEVAGATRLVESEKKATKRPSAEIEATWELPFPCSPAAFAEASLTSPVAMSLRNACNPEVAGVTRLVAADLKATYLPFEDMTGVSLPQSPGVPAAFEDATAMSHGAAWALPAENAGRSNASNIGTTNLTMAARRLARGGLLLPQLRSPIIFPCAAISPTSSKNLSSCLSGIMRGILVKRVCGLVMGFKTAASGYRPVCPRSHGDFS